MGLHGLGPGVLRHLHLWVWHCQQRYHDGGLNETQSTSSSRVSGHHGGYREGCCNGMWCPQSQVTRRQQHFHTPQLYSGKHRHALGVNRYVFSQISAHRLFIWLMELVQAIQIYLWGYSRFTDLLILINDQKVFCMIFCIHNSKYNPNNQHRQFLPMIHGASDRNVLILLCQNCNNPSLKAHSHWQWINC